MYAHTYTNMHSLTNSLTYIFTHILMHSKNTKETSSRNNKYCRQIKKWKKENIIIFINKYLLNFYQGYK